MTKKSYDHLYVARGIGILLVIIGHIIPQESYFGMTIYSFHMPLFILLSGIFARTCKDTKFTAYLKNSFVKVLVPFFVFLGLGILLNLAIPEWRVNLTADNFKDLLFTFNPWYWKSTGALWFLPALFIIRILFYFYDKLILSKGNRLIIFISMGLLFYAAFYAVVFEQWAGFNIRFQLKSALIGLPFYTFGYLFKDEIKNFKITKKSFAPIFFFICCAVLTFRFAARYNRTVNLGGNWYNDSFMFILFSFSGIYVTIVLSSLLKKSNLLQFLGKESMNIFLIHLTFQHLMELYLTNVMQQEIERGFTMQNVLKFCLIVACSSLFAYSLTSVKTKIKAKKGKVKV